MEMREINPLPELFFKMKKAPFLLEQYFFHFWEVR